MKRPPLHLSVVALALAVLVGLAGCGSSAAGNPPAATVGSHEIAQKQLDDELNAILANTKYVSGLEQAGTPVRGTNPGTTFDLGFVSRVLTRQILLDLIHQEFVKRKLSLAAGDLDKAKTQVTQDLGGPDVFAQFPKSYQDDVTRRTAEVTKLQENLAGAKVDDAAVKAYYDAHSADFQQTCVSHILFGVVGSDGQIDQTATGAQSDQLKSQADQVRSQIVGGSLDFAAAAKQYSVDTSNKEQGGDLGCGGPGRFVQQFEDGMNATAVGDVSPPVQTQFGWHLIKVTKRGPQTLAEATPEIQQTLTTNAQGGLSDFLQTQVKKTKISVNPRYGRWTNDGQQPGIKLPSAPTTTEPGQQPDTSNPFGAPTAP
ncbi:MAG TPA: peptidylprolyl isomerase [Acidimicrobiales bacterium]|nr:peptidylprolyl isomerase [Acidimicrobiales bacterium]